VVLGPSVGLNPSSTCLKAFAISPSLPPDLYSIPAPFPCPFYQNVSSSFPRPLLFPPLLYDLRWRQPHHFTARERLGDPMPRAVLSSFSWRGGREGEGAPSFIKLASAGQKCSPLEHVFFAKAPPPKLNGFISEISSLPLPRLLSLEEYIRFHKRPSNLAICLATPPCCRFAYMTPVEMVSRGEKPGL